MESNELDEIQSATQGRPGENRQPRGQRRISSALPRSVFAALTVLAIALVFAFGTLERTWIERLSDESAKRFLTAAKAAFGREIADRGLGLQGSAFASGRDWEAFLVDAAGRVVSGDDRNGVARLAAPGTRLIPKDGGTLRLDSARLAGTPLTVVSVTRLDLYERLATAILIAMAASLALSIAGSYAVLRTLLGRSLKPLGKIDEIARAVSEGDLTPRIRSESDDEIGDLASLFDRVMDEFASLVTKMKSAIASLGESIQNLSASTQEIASTSNEQAASVKEVLSTMEDSDRLSKGVEQRIGEVERIANHTKDNVARGFELIQSNLGKMAEIRSTNAETLSGIKTLGDQIETIWDIVNIINGIADQTKIIAFNAELEAAAAGDAGKNFRIVADEIRRLADGTVDSTNEIKAKINEIQRASDKLILASERGTQRIKEGWEVSTNIRGVFEDVLRSSEISASSATDISRSIKMQVVAFDQIFLTLKQISEGIDSFVESTSYTTEVSDLLASISASFKEQIAAYTLHHGAEILVSSVPEAQP